MSGSVTEAADANSMRRLHRLGTVLIGLAAAETFASDDISASVHVLNLNTQDFVSFHVLTQSDDKPSPLPASKASIDALPRIKATQDSFSGDEAKDCAICLEQIGCSGEIREMPCKHGFHSDCIEKWLGLHGSCPVCRYAMPVGDEDGSNDGDGSEADGRRQRRRVSTNVNALIVIGSGRTQILGLRMPMNEGA